MAFLNKDGLKYLLSIIKNALNKKVDKETGKGLSTNDYSTTEKNKVDTAYTHSQSSHAPANAQKNVIETITIGGAKQTVTGTTAALPAYPTTLPASDVSSWTKAASKPSYTTAEVGLGNVENKSGATIRSEMTKAEVVAALGYTPPATDTTYPTGTASTSGVTKLYTNTGTATDGSMTQAAITTALGGKSNTGHTHDDRYFTETEITEKLKGKSDTGHTHDDRYFTETEITEKLKGKSDTGHTHDLSTMINTLSTGTATPTDNDYYISQHVGGGDTTTAYYRKPISTLWNYIKGKLSTVAISGSYNDLSNKPTIGTDTVPGLTKLYTATGTAIDGTMSQAAIKNALDEKSATNHTHNYAGSNSAGGVANSAEKLAIARHVTGGIDIILDFSYDGSANSVATIDYYNCLVKNGNTNNYPYHRFAKIDNVTEDYTDKTMTIFLSQDFREGFFGIARISLRLNNSSTISMAEVKWLVRSGFSADAIQIGLYNVGGKT